MTAIIILNWNGGEDTIALLSSLKAVKNSITVVIVDNGSTDNSLSKITKFVEGVEYNVDILPLSENMGFAKGNNIGIAYAMRYNPDNFLVLNNDTEVTPNFLNLLLNFSIAHPEYRILTPRINLYSQRDRVWNCGGRLRCGFRKYYYAGANQESIEEKEYIPISFVTGCALFFYPEILDDKGNLFTERFFFGEEDFEFSMRMKQLGIGMAVVLDSLIYHKVGSSLSERRSIAKTYLYYLNRTVDIRLHTNAICFRLWWCVTLPLILRYFYRDTISISKTVRLLRRLYQEAKHCDGVTKSDFEEIVLHNGLDRE